MLVRLKRTFYAGGSYGRFRKHPNRREAIWMPDELWDKLPRDAVIVGEDPTPTAEVEAEDDNLEVAEEAADAGEDNPELDPDGIAQAAKQEDDIRAEADAQEEIKISRRQEIANALAAEKHANKGKREKK